ncbi:hypothetical protein X975_26784, partial [Stegodyphus mimosarum]
MGVKISERHPLLDWNVEVYPINGHCVDDEPRTSLFLRCRSPGYSPHENFWHSTVAAKLLAQISIEETRSVHIEDSVKFSLLIPIHVPLKET